MGASLWMLRWRAGQQEMEGTARTAHYWPMAAGVALAVIGLVGGIFAFNYLMQLSPDNAYAQQNGMKSLEMYVVYLVFGLALVYIAHSWAKTKYEAVRLQEGSFSNFLFDDTEAKEEAAKEEPEGKGTDAIARRLATVEKRLDNLEKAAELEKRVRRLEEKTAGRR
jgi:hypothetical protein